MNPGFLGLDTLIGLGRHLAIGPPVYQINIFGIESGSRFDTIHGHRSAADNGNGLALYFLFYFLKASVTQRRQVVY